MTSLGEKMLGANVLWEGEQCSPALLVGFTVSLCKLNQVVAALDRGDSSPNMASDVESNMERDRTLAQGAWVACWCDKWELFPVQTIQEASRQLVWVCHTVSALNERK